MEEGGDEGRGLVTRKVVSQPLGLIPRSSGPLRGYGGSDNKGLYLRSPERVTVVLTIRGVPSGLPESDRTGTDTHNEVTDRQTFLRGNSTLPLFFLLNRRNLDLDPPTHSSYFHGRMCRDGRDVRAPCVGR